MIPRLKDQPYSSQGTPRPTSTSFVVRPTLPGTGGGPRVAWGEPSVSLSAGSTEQTAYGSMVELEGDIPDLAAVSVTGYALPVSMSISTSGTSGTNSASGGIFFSAAFYDKDGLQIKLSAGDYALLAQQSLYGRWLNYSAWGPPWDMAADGDARSLVTYSTVWAVDPQPVAETLTIPKYVSLHARGTNMSGAATLRVSLYWVEVEE